MRRIVTFLKVNDFFVVRALRRNRSFEQTLAKAVSSDLQPALAELYAQPPSHQCGKTAGAEADQAPRRTWQ